MPILGKERKTILGRNRSNLGEVDLENGLLLLMEQNGVTSKAQRQRIQKAIDTGNGGHTELYDNILDRGSEEKYDKFCECLISSGQQHFVYDILWPELVNTQGDTEKSTLLSPERKKILTKNMSTLVENLSSEDELLNKLLEREIINKTLKNGIEKIINIMNKRNEILLDAISRSSNEKFEIFCKILHEEGQEGVAEILWPEYDPEAEQEVEEPKRNVTDDEKKATPSTAPDVKKENGQVTNGAEVGSGDITSGDTDEPDRSDLPRRQVKGIIKEICIPKCTPEFYSANKSNAYPMDQKNRGKVLIINVNKVTGCSERKGTDVDRDNLKNLYEELGFKVEVKNDSDGLEAEEIDHHVKTFSSQPSLKSAQCVVVAILSHGKKGGVILGTDGMGVRRNDLLKYFDNDNKHLRGKPKIFLFQACRGGIADDGVPLDAADDVEEVKMPSMSDSYLAFPTAEGYKSWRNHAEGSWFISAFVDQMMENAAILDIDRIFNRVNGVMVSRETKTLLFEENKKKQMSEQTKNLTKDLYFFPGIIQE